MGCSASKPITIITNKTPENHFPITTNTTTSESSNSSSPNQTQNQTQTPKAFSLTTPLIHHPPIRKGDTHHLVSLTSTTYGYGSLLTPKTPPFQPPNKPKNDTKPPKTTQQEENQYSLSPDSVINTWELMHGLDDVDGADLLHPINLRRPMINPRSRPGSCRYPSQNDFDYLSFCSHSTSSSSSSSSSSKPLWQHLSEESLLAKMDPNVGLAYRRALSSRQLAYNKHSKTRSLGSTTSFSSTNWPTTTLPRKEGRAVVLYFTSLRGIRKTHEDCRAVRAILRGFGVVVDERDVSMDSELRSELRAALGGEERAAARLPHVFVGGRHVGGAEEVRRLHEAGELGALLEGVRRVEGGVVACGVCGEARFVPCGRCSGSRKVFEAEEGGLRRCKECNENGLIRCPSCCCTLN